MAGVTYKCLNCGAYLAFDPETQKWKCPFCDSVFEESGLEEKDSQSEEKQSVPGGSEVLYRCPNCGSEIITDETTVATSCYYCHSPVVLEGKLQDSMRPDSVLPFTIDRAKALNTFEGWIKSKKYVPKAFYSPAQIEHLSGVYYPHFITECELDGTLEGEGRNSSVANTPNYIVTTTEHYHVRRDARMRFRNIIRPALTKANRKLSDAIHPFPLDGLKPFSDAYLTGFMAERRDIDAKEIRSDIEQEVGQYVQPMLNDTLHYSSQSVTPSAKVRRVDSRYVLLPTWVLTYPNKQNPSDPYYYAMNGCTGEVCGKLPVDKSLLRRKALMIGALVFAIGCVLCYFVL